MNLSIDIISYIFNWLSIEDIYNFMRISKKYWNMPRLLKFRHNFKFMGKLTLFDGHYPPFVITNIDARVLKYHRRTLDIVDLKNFYLAGRFDIINAYSETISRGNKYQLNKLIGKDIF